MSMLIIGFIVIVIIFGAAAAFLYSGTSGVVGLGRVTAVGSAGGSPRPTGCGPIEARSL